MNMDPEMGREVRDKLDGTYIIITAKPSVHKAGEVQGYKNRFEQNLLRALTRGFLRKPTLIEKEASGNCTDSSV